MFYLAGVCKASSTAVPTLSVVSPRSGVAKKQLGLPASQISVIPNGIDISHFKPGTASSFKNELGMDEKQPLITLCSRIAGQDASDRMLSMLWRSSTKQKGALAIVGSPR